MDGASSGAVSYTHLDVYKRQIYGGGFGHGSGMSQNGAMEMAKSGKNYKDILKSYYHGIETVSYTHLKGRGNH